LVRGLGTDINIGYLDSAVNINPKVLTISIEKRPVFQVVNFGLFTEKDQNKSNDYNERKTGLKKFQINKHRSIYKSYCSPIE